MACPTLLNDLEENFFQCIICKEQLKEPKLLPCLHRYCRDCLSKVIEASTSTSIKCPMCRQQCAIPRDGVDGFKTDFYVDSILEFIQSQKSFTNTDQRKCVSCSKHKEVSAYCFKCRDILCEQCYKVHISSKMFTDHKLRTLKFDDTEGRGITLEKLATLTEDPRCRTHMEERAILCCSTCSNEPVCVICVHSKHKGHDLQDVTELAKKERELLKLKFAELQNKGSNLCKLPSDIEETKQQLSDNVSRRRDMLSWQYKQQVQKIDNKLTECKNVRIVGLNDIENRKKEERKIVNGKYEEELHALNDKYRELRKRTDTKYKSECQKLNRKCDKVKDDLVSIRETLDGDFKRLTKSIDSLAKQNRNELQKVSDYCDQITKRHQNFSATTSAILSSRNEWKDVQCIPDVRAAAQPLIDETKEDFPDLDLLSDIVINDLSRVFVDDVILSENEESVVDLDDIKAKGWWITGMTCSNGNENIVISGLATSDYSHITVINRKGEALRQEPIKGETQHNTYPYRYCSYLSVSRVVTLCEPNEIGMFNVQNGCHKRKYISRIILNWPADRCVWCVATDRVKKRVIFGDNSKYLYVFDHQLNYSHALTLPGIIKSSRDLCVHGENLLICDRIGERAYAVAMMESGKTTMMYEFTKPDIHGYNWVPFRVCTDSNNFIYMLWRTYVSERRKCILVQYSHSEGKILTTRDVDQDAINISNMAVNEEEKLLIETFKSGKLYEYGLIVK